MNLNQNLLLQYAKQAMDLYAPKMDFPNHAFTLFDDGSSFLHIVTRKGEMPIKGIKGAFRMATYDTYPSTIKEKFDKDFLLKLFNAMEKHGESVDEIAAIPFTDEREQEVLSLGECIGSMDKPGNQYKMIKFSEMEGKIIKLYKPPVVFKKGEKLH